MTRNKNWFIKLDESVKKGIKYVDGRHVTWDGKGDIFVVKNDGRKASITNVLYIPPMTRNLIIIGQIIVKGNNLKLEENHMKVYNCEGRMILKSPLTYNKSFKIKINTIDHQCVTSTVVEDKNLLLHHIYRHLNLRGVSMLNQKKMVYGLP